MNVPRLRVLIAFFCFSVPAFASGASDFVLRDLGGGNAEIAEYRGNAARVPVPAMLDGKRIVSVGDWAFAGNAALREVIFPSGLRAIGAGAFSNCTGLENVRFSVVLEKIGDRAFFGCPKLAGLDLEYQFGLKEIGQEAFALCAALKSETARVPAGFRAGKDAFPPNVKPANAALPEIPIVPEALPAPEFESVDAPPQNPLNTNGGRKYVLIIANEKYAHMRDVAYAERDGAAFRNYCIQTLGIPLGNITSLKNATAWQVCQEIDNFIARGNRAKKSRRDIDFIVYYAGHGIPFDRSEKSCLLPSDGKATAPDPAFELSSLYERLGNSGAKTVSFFIDACFSGSDRDGVGDGRLARPAPAEPLTEEAARKALPPNVAVFSAAALNQAAWGISEQKHGVFTYVLLKKLKETKGEISYEALRDSLMWDVPETAQAARGVVQEASAVFGEAFPKDKKLFEK